MKDLQSTHPFSRDENKIQSKPRAQRSAGWQNKQQNKRPKMRTKLQRICMNKLRHEYGACFKVPFWKLRFDRDVHAVGMGL